MNPESTTTTLTGVYVGQTVSNFPVAANVPTGGKSPPDAPTFGPDTGGMLTGVTFNGPWEASDTTPGLFTASASFTISSLGSNNGTTVLPMLLDGVDEPPNSDLTVVATARPTDQLAWGNPAQAVITG